VVENWGGFVSSSACVDVNGKKSSRKAEVSLGWCWQHDLLELKHFHATAFSYCDHQPNLNHTRCAMYLHKLDFNIE
jgi:hypothetical protein